MSVSVSTDTPATAQHDGAEIDLRTGSSAAPDLTFARASAYYLFAEQCPADEVLIVLTEELGLDENTSQSIIREATGRLTDDTPPVEGERQPITM